MRGAIAWLVLIRKSIRPPSLTKAVPGETSECLTESVFMDLSVGTASSWLGSL